MYTYEISESPVLAKIFYNGLVIDIVGPWDERESAELWAESYTNKMNIGIK
jgi:hypothetical protein